MGEVCLARPLPCSPCDEPSSWTSFRASLLKLGGISGLEASQGLPVEAAAGRLFSKRLALRAEAEVLLEKRLSPVPRELLARVTLRADITFPGSVVVQRSRRFRAMERSALLGFCRALQMMGHLLEPRFEDFSPNWARFSGHEASEARPGRAGRAAAGLLFSKRLALALAPPVPTGRKAGTSRRTTSRRTAPPVAAPVATSRCLLSQKGWHQSGTSPGTSPVSQKGWHQSPGKEDGTGKEGTTAKAAGNSDSLGLRDTAPVLDSTQSHRFTVSQKGWHQSPSRPPVARGGEG